MSRQIILFTSQGCIPCRTIKENLPDLMRQYGVDFIVHKIDYRTEEAKAVTSDFKYSIGVPQGFAMFTPGLVIREIPSGNILASTDGGNANLDWIVLELEKNPNPFDFLDNPLPSTIAIPGMFSSFGSNPVDSELLESFGLYSEKSKNGFLGIFTGNDPASLGIRLLVMGIFIIGIYLLIRLLLRNKMRYS